MLFAYALPQALERMISDSGKVLFLFSIVRLFPSTSSSLLKKFLTSSRESLFLYMSHLMIIYGSPLNPGLSRFFKGSLSVSSALLFFILLILTLYPASYYLNKLKSDHFELYNSIKYSIFVFFFFVFILSKW